MNENEGKTHGTQVAQTVGPPILHNEKAVLLFLDKNIRPS